MIEIDNEGCIAAGDVKVKLAIPETEKTLNFYQMFGYHVGIHWLQKIADNISQLQQLNTLNFNHTDVNGDRLRIVATMIERCPALTEIYLDESCEDFKAVGYQVLLKSLEKASHSRAIEIYFGELPCAIGVSI